MSLLLNVVTYLLNVLKGKFDYTYTAREIQICIFLFPELNLQKYDPLQHLFLFFTLSTKFLDP